LDARGTSFHAGNACRLQPHSTDDGGRISQVPPPNCDGLLECCGVRLAARDF